MAITIYFGIGIALAILLMIKEILQWKNHFTIGRLIFMLVVDFIVMTVFYPFFPILLFLSYLNTRRNIKRLEGIFK